MSPAKYSVKLVREGETIEQCTTQNANLRRIGVRLKRPNPLFEVWLEEMIAKAEEKNTMGKIALQKALNSLRRYPLPLASGRDCIVLMDFGKTICDNLDRRLKAYLASGGRVTTDHSGAIEAILNDEQAEYYRELTEACRINAEEPAQEVEPIEEAMPNDSIFDHVPVAAVSLGDGDFVRISHPKAILLVDTCETIGKSKSSLDRTLQQLAQHSVAHEVRRLTVGDFAWIVKADDGREFLLPYILERKRIDDLASSIKDGRFHEQKFRLKQCGLPNVIYLIEHLGNNRQVGVPEATLTQAALNTYVQGFTVKYTENHHHTVLYLSVMTNFLNNYLKDKLYLNVTDRPASDDPRDAFRFSSQTVPLLSFDYFYKQSAKTRDSTVQDVFMKQLLQIKLLTIEKVNAIVDKYPTPQRLFRAYERCPSETERQRLLNLPYGPTNRMIGEKLSKIIYQLMMSERYNTS
ncbi:crossover junction endonuclease MUS81-like [Anopheles stephensi]|uniref:Crossover junction endonuclease MUS81 n=1 Tax=Anopheles stephensi TaxID=30069 RepID=A0A182Y981_ANOST|nr:crossover junction endonuclease MUS81-like [Anopheles stephensi]XP_035915435.1 crossover junction endonuclease MUS81-like [Anopheles stephensi]XP_035917810.1 crossover junction endonuclease MUS81-like [Anopheles stephensi]